MVRKGSGNHGVPGGRWIDSWRDTGAWLVAAFQLIAPVLAGIILVVAGAWLLLSRIFRLW